eukprot:m.253914 g.253914  ORF g.253914 m.253914 type:complete len:54 (+) comp40376_c1_seq7:212-373(+)
MDASFQQVSRRYGFPYDRSNKTSIVDWLLGAAVRLEYADNVLRDASCREELMR